MFNNFPYTNFHNLNLDWIIKTVKLLFNKAVFSINNIEPDAEGNITITGAELGAIGTVNNIAPVDGNVTITASDVGAIAQGVGVTKVNGFSPDSSGNVLAGTVRSINGISPASLPTPGNVVLTASDVGALPSTIDPVETVNGISPDAQGNVNVGTVKSVNGSAPDAQGNVNLPTVAGVTSVDGIGPDAQGNVSLSGRYVETVNNKTPTNGNVSLNASEVGAVTSRTSTGTVTWNTTNTDDGYTGKSSTYVIADGLCFVYLRFKALVRVFDSMQLASGLPAPRTGTPGYLDAFTTTAPGHSVRLRVDSNGNLTAYYAGVIEADETVMLNTCYPIANP